MGLLFSIFEIHANGSNSNSGMFDPNATLTTTLVTSNGNSVNPSVTASNYTFISSDIGNYLYIKSGTNWNPGWYRITAVNAGAATVDATIGNVFQPNHRISIVQGVSTTASASSGSWTIDYSQITTASRTYTDLAIVTNASYVQSAAFPFTVNMIGNSIKVSGGVNFTVGLYIITNVVGTTAYLDKNVGTLGATGGTGSQGGALLNWDGFSAPTATFGTNLYVYVKGSSGIFNWSGVPTITNCIPTAIGYSNVRGDYGKPNIKLSASSTAFNSAAFIYLSNMAIDGQNNTGTVGVTNGNFQTYNYVVNCDFKNIALATSFNSGIELYRCSFDGCLNVATGYSRSVRNCVIKNSSGTFNYCDSGSGNVFINHTGNCFYLQNTAKIMNNTFYNITGNVIRMFYSFQDGQVVRSLVENNLFSNVSGYAIDNYGGGSSTMNVIDNNAYFSCTSGFTNNIIIANNSNQPPFTNRNNIALSTSPFMSATNLDLRLNNDIGAGRSCRGAGQLQAIPLTATISSLDIGAVQTTSYSVDRTLGPLSKTVDMKANTTSYSEYINLASTGYTFNTATLKAYYVRPNLTSTSISLASQTVSGTWVSGGFVEVDPINMPGLYRFDVPNEVIASGVSNSMLQIVNTSNNDRVNINYKFFDSQILDLSITVPTTNTDQTVGDALNAARAYGFGKWVINGNNLEYYAPDNSTIIKTFTLDNPNYPRSRGSIFSTNGLVMNLDAKNTSSYPGSGNTWFDISGYSNNVTLTNGPVWNALGYFANDIDSYFTGAGTAAIPVGNSSYSMFVYVRMATWSGQRGFISIGGYGTNNQSNAITSNATIGYFSHYWWFNDLVISNNNANIALNRWFYLGVTFDGTTRKVYVDGIVVGSDTPINHNVTSTTIQISKAYNTEYQIGDVAAAQIYNRALTIEEVSLNLLYLRNRFGL
jgi:hypothetical protein